ncbi:hypothetical protein [Lyngbya aestuarii]|uniref:hypothetical protein n=1 Tax=Lyngbya aestuarii TaxID=118322 RepID=UPI00403DDD0F
MNRFIVSFSIVTSSIVGVVTALMLPHAQADTQHLLSQREPDMDNIYHEDNNLPDDADVFPRIGKIKGRSSELSNCRATPWGTVVKSFPGNVSVEVGTRKVDPKGESWFNITGSGCWIHESRINLL